MNKITMKDIAQIAGVSKATVSMVINNKDKNISKTTRDRVLEVCKDMNYVPNAIARSLSTKRTQSIGIIVPDITNPFFAEMCRAIEDSANARKYNVILCNTDNNPYKERDYLKLLISKFIDGIILISHRNDTKSLEILKDNNIPCVLVDRYMENSKDYYGVFCNEEKGIKEGIHYLYENKKRRKIIFVTGDMELEISKKRLNTFIKFTRELGIYNEELIKEGDFSVNSGIKTTEIILNEHLDFDAIFYSNDLMAIGGIKTLLKRGISIPKEVNILGYDNIQISSLFEPEITTVAQPIYEMGEKSCNFLIDIIEGFNILRRDIVLHSKLVIRNT